MLILFWASPIVYSWSYVVNAAVLVRPAVAAGRLPAEPRSPIAVLAFQKGIWLAGSESA